MKVHLRPSRGHYIKSAVRPDSPLPLRPLIPFRKALAFLRHSLPLHSYSTAEVRAICGYLTERRKEAVDEISGRHYSQEKTTKAEAVAFRIAMTGSLLLAKTLAQKAGIPKGDAEILLEKMSRQGKLKKAPGYRNGYVLG